MNQTKPITSYEKVKSFKEYYLKKGAYRNYLLVTISLNTALRISDVLRIKTEDIYSISKKRFNSHLILTEKKTGKKTEILLNKEIKKAFKVYAAHSGIEKGYIFKNNQGTPISRVQAYRIIKNGAKAVGINASCHSLRKTFGYYAWKNGTPAVLLMKIYNHSSFEITKRYLGIEQEDKDAVFKKIAL